jgi:hypothetical protein
MTEEIQVNEIKVKIQRVKRPTPQDMREKAVAEIRKAQPDITDDKLNAQLKAMGDLGGVEPVISISVPRPDRAPDQIHLLDDAHDVDPDAAAIAIATGGWEQAPDSPARLRREAAKDRPDAVKTDAAKTEAAKSEAAKSEIAKSEPPAPQQ